MSRGIENPSKLEWSMDCQLQLDSFVIDALILLLFGKAPCAESEKKAHDTEKRLDHIQLAIELGHAHLIRHCVSETVMAQAQDIIDKLGADATYSNVHVMQLAAIMLWSIDGILGHEQHMIEQRATIVNAILTSEQSDILGSLLDRLKGRVH